MHNRGKGSRNPRCLLEFHRAPFIVREQRPKHSPIHSVQFKIRRKLGKFLPVAYLQCKRGYPCESNRGQGQWFFFLSIQSLYLSNQSICLSFSHQSFSSDWNKTQNALGKLNYISIQFFLPQNTVWYSGTCTARPLSCVIQWNMHCEATLLCDTVEPALWGQFQMWYSGTCIVRPLSCVIQWNLHCEATF